MSMLTGKCDFYDSVNMIGNIEEYLGDNAEIYVGDIRIPNETEKDIALYYPFLISTAFHSNERNVIHLSRYSYTDYEEYDILTRLLKEVIRYYKKCKRDKIEFRFDKFMTSNYRYHFVVDDDIYKELFNRVKNKGEKASIFGLSLPYYDKYARPRFYELLVELGYNEQFAHNWVYGRKNQLWYERHYED